MESLLNAVQLGGYAAAHSIWCVSSGENLIPLIMWMDEAGERQLERMVAPRLEDGVAQQKERMIALAGFARCASSAYDGFLNVDGARMDTLFLEVRDFSSTDARILFGISYTPKKFLQKFTVNQLRVLEAGDLTDAELKQVQEALMEGFAEHPKGAEIVKKHFKLV